MAIADDYPEGTQELVLAHIADELRKLRVLREYELGVLTGEDDGLHLVVGTHQKRIGGGVFAGGIYAERGQIVWDEDLGSHPADKAVADAEEEAKSKAVPG